MAPYIYEENSDEDNTTGQLKKLPTLANVLTKVGKMFQEQEWEQYVQQQQHRVAEEQERIRLLAPEGTTPEEIIDTTTAPELSELTFEKDLPPLKEGSWKSANHQTPTWQPNMLIEYEVPQWRYVYRITNALLAPWEAITLDVKTKEKDYKETLQKLHSRILTITFKDNDVVVHYDQMANIQATG
ncbi:hypothetical protein FRB99_006048, partial [Tulasnella sp. 403]